MNSPLFSQYAPLIKNHEIRSLDDRLLMDRDGKVSIYYAPFDFINPHAKLVIVGITPGKTQMFNALKEAHVQLRLGSSDEVAIRAAKKTASFSGTMRPNLVDLLNRIGLNERFGIETCNDLFGSLNHLVQTTSVLRFPVFTDGENYNGTPAILTHPLLRRHLMDYFGREAASLPNALFVPLGDKVGQALQFLVREGVINEKQILHGLPHPSGANAERIAYFLGRKARAALSTKTDANKLDQALTALRAKVLA